MTEKSLVILTEDTPIALLCCADAFEATLMKGEIPSPDQLRLAIDAMRRAIDELTKRSRHE